MERQEVMNTKFISFTSYDFGNCKHYVQPKQTMKHNSCMNSNDSSKLRVLEFCIYALK
jgi:hypothetical protein